MNPKTFYRRKIYTYKNSGDFFQFNVIHADGNVSDVEGLETKRDSDDYVRQECQNLGLQADFS